MERDSFKCYQSLERDIAFIEQYGVDQFDEAQKARESILGEMLDEFNDGRSKSYYCIAATVMEMDELRVALDRAGEMARSLDVKARSAALRSVLDDIAEKRGYVLRLRR